MVSKNTTPGKSGYKSVRIYPGLSICRVDASPHFYARIWKPKQRKYLVRSTAETSRIEAAEAARELYRMIERDGGIEAVDQTRTFKHFAQLMPHQEICRARSGESSLKNALNRENYLLSPNIGLATYLGDKTVDTVGVADVKTFFAHRDSMRKKPLAPQTRNIYIGLFKKVLRYAHERNALERLPIFPSQSCSMNDDRLRPAFRFAPLVSDDEDEYQLLLNTCHKLADEGCVARGVPVTQEIYDLTEFLVLSFVRPTISELFSLTHDDVQVKPTPRRLTIRIRRGKTGFRYVDTLSKAVDVYERILRCRSDVSPVQHVFLLEYDNLITARRVISRQFIVALETAGLRFDPLAEAIATAKKRRAVLLVARLDKFSRCVSFISWLMEQGVDLKVVEMPNASTFQLHIHAALAEEERRIISERTKAALQAAKRRGVKLGKTGKDRARENREKLINLRHS